MHGMNREDGRHRGGQKGFDASGGRGAGRGFAERGPGGGHRGGGRRGKRFAGEELRLMVLGLLETEEPQHGYQLIRGFSERSGGAYSPSPGVLYPLLTLLHDMGQIEEAREEGGNRRSYRLTDSGRTELEAGREALDALFARVKAMAKTAARTDGGPVRRAIMNLRAAIHGRLGRDDADDALVFEAAAILDEAAQKIERL